MYGTKVVKREDVKPGQLLRFNGKTWTASANTSKALYLMSVLTQTCTKEDTVEIIITKATDAL